MAGRKSANALEDIIPVKFPNFRKRVEYIPDTRYLVKYHIWCYDYFIMSNVIVQVGPSEKMENGRELLHATIGGTMGAEEIKVVKSWVSGVRDSVKLLSAGAEASVCIIIDIKQMETYSDPAIISMVTELMKEDSTYVYKTATFGGTALHEMIEGVIRTLSGRTNLQNFKTEAEAMEWLKK